MILCATFMKIRLEIFQKVNGVSLSLSLWRIYYVMIVWYLLWQHQLWMFPTRRAGQRLDLSRADGDTKTTAWLCRQEKRPRVPLHWSAGSCRAVAVTTLSHSQGLWAVVLGFYDGAAWYSKTRAQPECFFCAFSPSLWSGMIFFMIRSQL